MPLSPTNWPIPDLADIRLAPGEVHLWLAHLVVPDDTLQLLQAYLSPDEVARAARFYFERDRDRFILSHAALRLLLSRYCQVSPQELRFVTNSYGKPVLQSASEQPMCYFNLSHSHEMALYGFTWVSELGVDVEYMRLIEYEQLATHFFSPREGDVLQALPTDLKADGFFNAWTRKEAYIKARGKGVSIPLDQFDVSLRPEEPAALLETREPGQHTSSWSMHALAAPAGYKAALALPAHGTILRCYSLPLTKQAFIHTLSYS